MARVTPQTAQWTPPIDVNVVKHRIYVVAATEVLDYTSPHAELDMPLVSYLLPGIFTMGVEQDYKLGLSALDSAGNESDIVEVVRFFDFNPPAAPVGFEIIAG